MTIQPWIVELPNGDNTESCFVGVPDLCEPCDVVVPLHFLWTMLVRVGYEVTRPGWGVIVFVPPKRMRTDYEVQLDTLKRLKEKADAKWLAEQTDGPADDAESLASQEVL